LHSHLNDFVRVSLLHRILNRFTKDMYYMDDLLPMTMYDFIVCSFMVTGGTLIVFVVNPWVVLRCL
ncbi:unnamed protein product, partial [Scytosiphon promiscuus]